jgi:SagB-type dehydrogenase family enzyme
MGFREIVRLLDGTHPVEDAVTAYEEATRDLARERRGHFVALGADPDDVCPAARVYHAESAITRDWTPRLTSEESHAHALNLGYKRYPGAPSVTLPGSADVSQRGVTEAIHLRRSVNEFTDAPMDLGTLAALLRGSCGVTRRGELPLRAAPSAGALYPIETYVLAFRVDGLEAGLYHYALLADELERVSDLADRRQVVAAVLAPGLADATPPAIVAMTAVLPRVEAKYGERGYRFSLLEAGHIAQNLYLLASGLGLAGSAVGGFCDAELARVLRLDDPAEVAVYLFLTGWPGSETPDEPPAP